LFHNKRANSAKTLSNFLGLKVPTIYKYFSFQLLLTESWGDEFLY
jgi:hypothetical protein